MSNRKVEIKRRRLGETGMEVSEVSLGSFTMGARDWERTDAVAWAEPDEEDVRRAVHEAMDYGVNLFDNSDVYGTGRGEKMLARALKGGLTNKVFIATRVAQLPGSPERAYTPYYIEHQCRRSLTNLERKHIDIYYLHLGYFGCSQRFLEGAAAEMRSLRGRGMISAIGLHAATEDDVATIASALEPDVISVEASYLNDLFVRPGNAIPEIAQRRGIAMVADGPFQEGLLLDRFRPGHAPDVADVRHPEKMKDFANERLSAAHAKLARVKERFGRSESDLARAAIGYLLAQGDHVSTVVVPWHDLDTIRPILEHGAQPLPQEDVEWLQRLAGE